MNYDLSNPLDRRRFIKRGFFLLKNNRKNVKLVDESDITLNQNSYLHVLVRIIAIELGVTESDAKAQYFKKAANAEIFRVTKTDPLTGEIYEDWRHSYELTIEEASKAIDRFIQWAGDHGYYLPEAGIADDGSVVFKSERDKEAFRQAKIETSKYEQYL